MTRHLRRVRAALGRKPVVLLLCVPSLLACGPSAHELRLQTTTNELHAEVREQRQYNQDLKLRLQLAGARNKVLVDLVRGLTSDTTRARNAPESESPAQELAHSSLQALDADLGVLVTSVRHSQEDIAAMQAQRAALEAELGRAKAAVEVARAEQAKEQARSEAFRAMREQLAPLISEGNLAVRVVDKRMVLELPDAMLFASGDARVLPSGQALLSRVAEVLETVQNREFQVADHTDSRPLRRKRFADKWRLSAERALAVMLYLVERGVPNERLSASAYADTRPLADPTTEANPSRNGRIEIVLLPTADELPDLSNLESPSP